MAHSNNALARPSTNSVRLGLGLIICGFAAGCNSKAPKPSDPNRPPNIVLISIDSLRRDHLSCYGNINLTSPEIDRLARRGMLFEQMVSSSCWTLPAHASMFTGLVETVHGLVDGKHRLDASRPTVATILRSAGYTTAGFFAGPFLHPVFGLGQGFSQYVDCSSYAGEHDEAAKPGTDDMKERHDESHSDITNPRVLEEVKAWLAAKPREPFLLFIHLWDVHYDYIPPAPYDTVFDSGYTGSMTAVDFLNNPAINKDMPARDLDHLKALYDGEIAWTDSHIGKIFAALHDLGVESRTDIILTADHGDGFFEHGLKGHRNSLFGELLRVPLIIAGPDVPAAGARCPAQVRTIDIAPTILALARIREQPPMMGRSLVPILRGNPPPPPETAISEFTANDRLLLAYRRPEYKLISNREFHYQHLYDLIRDPGEHKPIVDPANPLFQQALKDAAEVNESLRAWRERFEHPSEPANIPSNVSRGLRTLGYVGQDDQEPTTQPTPKKP